MISLATAQKMREKLKIFFELRFNAIIAENCRNPDPKLLIKNGNGSIVPITVGSFFFVLLPNSYKSVKHRVRQNPDN